MKTFLIVLFVLIAAQWSSAQNLVPNGSFEEHTGCPTIPDQIYLADGWSAYRETPDYYHECGNSALEMTVPNCAFGYQYAATGVAFAGIITFATTFADYRE